MEFLGGRGLGLLKRFIKFIRDLHRVLRRGAMVLGGGIGNRRRAGWWSRWMD